MALGSTDTVALVGTTGAIGKSVAAALRQKNRPYRVIGRSRITLERTLGGDPLAEAAVWDPDNQQPIRDALRGIAAGVSLAPILPDITDTRANLGAVIAAAREHGASLVFANVLFLKPSAQQAFFPFLQQHFPHLSKRYAARFARSAFLNRRYKDRVLRMVAELNHGHGFSDDSESDIPTTLHEAEAAQLPLLQFESETRAIPCIGTPPLLQRNPHPRGNLGKGC